MAFTDKQARFVAEYLVDLNATQAAIRAGYSAKTAYSQGDRLLKNVEVAAAVAERQKSIAGKLEITQERVVAELAKIGFADIRKVVNWKPNVTGMVEDENGEQRLAITNEVALISSDEIDDETAGAIAEISQTDKGGLKVKLHDKRGALVDLGKHLGIFKDQVEHSGNITVEVVRFSDGK